MTTFPGKIDFILYGPDKSPILEIPSLDRQEVKETVENTGPHSFCMFNFDRIGRDQVNIKWRKNPGVSQTNQDNYCSFMINFNGRL